MKFITQFPSQKINYKFIYDAESPSEDLALAARNEVLAETAVERTELSATVAANLEAIKAGQFISTETESHLNTVFEASSNDRANASIIGTNIVLQQNAMAVITDTIGSIIDEVSAQDQPLFVEAVNNFVQSTLTNAAVDIEGNGIDQANFENWQSQFENQLTLFLDSPESITEFQTKTPDELVSQSETFESQYSSQTLNILKASLSDTDYASLQNTAIANEMTEAHLMDFATLIGEIQAAHAKITIALPRFASDIGLGSANYETLTLRRLENIQAEMLNGGDLISAREFLASKDFQHLMRRIDGSETLVNGLTEKAELNESDELQRNNLITFLDSVEHGGGMFFTSRDLMPLITEARILLQEGDLVGAKQALQPLVQTIVGGIGTKSESWRDAFFDTLYLRGSVTAENANGVEQIITVDMIAKNPEALIQAIRAADDYEGATAESARAALNTNVEANVDSAEMQHFILNHIETNLEAEKEQARAALTESLRVLASSGNQVGYQTELQRIEANGEDSVVESIATAALGVSGFKAYAAQNPDANNLTEIYDDMTGGGYFDFNLSDANRDFGASILVETIVTGGIEGLARGVLRKIPSLANRLAPLTRQAAETVGRGTLNVGRSGINAAKNTLGSARAQMGDFIRSEASGFGRRSTASIGDVARAAVPTTVETTAINQTMYNLGRGLTRIPGLTSSAIKTIKQQAQRLGRAALNTADDLAERAAARSALIRQVQALPSKQLMGVTTTLATVPFIAPIIEDALSGIVPTAAQASPALPAPTTLITPGRPDTLTNIDTTSAAPIAPETEPAPEVEPALTTSEKIEAIGSSEIRSKGNQIRDIMEKYSDYQLGDWQNISNEIAELYDIQLTTEAERIDFGKQIQMQIKSILGLDAQTNKLNDGKIGRSTMDTLNRALVSVTPREILNAAEDLQNFEAQDGGWRANNRMMAEMFGINFPADATDAQLKVFGRSIQAFAGGTDGAIGSRTIGRMKTKLTDLDTA